MKSKVAIVLIFLIILWLFVPSSSEGSYILAVNEIIPANNDRSAPQRLNEVIPVISNENETDTQPFHEQDSSLSQEIVKPLKNYFLILLPDGSRQEVKIDPPATRIEVISESGDTIVRCGDSF